MKKVYLTILGITALTSSFSQRVTEVKAAAKKIHATAENAKGKSSNTTKALGSVLWSNDFSNSLDWTIGAANIQGQWTIINTSPPSSSSYLSGPMTSTTAANGFGYFNGVQYLIAGAVDPQDATLTSNDTLDFTNNPAVEISFEQRYRSFNTDQTWIEFSTNAGDTWTGIEVNKEYITNAPAVNTTKTQNISALVGGKDSVMFRFRWINPSADDNYGSGYGWMVDDISISSAADNNLTLISPIILAGPQELVYSKVPTNQISPIAFQSRIVNNGPANQPDANLEVTVAGGATYMDTITSISFLDTADFITTKFTPAANTVATYNFTYTATSSLTEDVPGDNSITGSISITNSEYRVDNGVRMGGISNISTEPTGAMKIGNIFEIINDDKIDSMYITLTSAATNVGQDFSGEIWIYNPISTDYEYLNSTDIVTITTLNNGTTVKLPLQSITDVSAGSILLVMASHSGGANSVEFGMAQEIPSGTVLGVPSSGDPLDIFRLNEPQAIMVGLSLNQDASLTENSNTISVSNMFPNPTTGSTAVNYTLANASKVSINVVDVAGKLVYSSTEGTQVAGKHTSTIDASSFNTGVYYVTILTNDSQVTKKLIKK
ncbi:MAG: T9SS type A sorting domain-containing protein [Fluviicola sp.]|nr:T9SS type A sorting domain-containing protein [Fluviicola sp.]